jgi:hypothetical protein
VVDSWEKKMVHLLEKQWVEKSENLSVGAKEKKAAEK